MSNTEDKDKIARGDYIEHISPVDKGLITRIYRERKKISTPKNKLMTQ
jgi:hypothetical protein